MAAGVANGLSVEVEALTWAFVCLRLRGNFRAGKSRARQRESEPTGMPRTLTWSLGDILNVGLDQREKRSLIN